jgi:hypothetical protein
MGFYDMEKNVVALKRGGSLENAMDLLFSGMLDAVLETNPEEANVAD